MDELNFNKWKKVSGILTVIVLIGYIIAFTLPSAETTGIILVLLGHFGGLVIASKIGFDNKSLWRGLTFLFPYIMLPIMYFRKYENVVRSKSNIEQRNLSNSMAIMVQKIEKIIRLDNKSTISSLMQAGGIVSEILDAHDNWESLSTLVLDKSINIEIRKEGINILNRIENNDFVDEIINNLHKDPNPEIKKIMADLIDIEDEG